MDKLDKDSKPFQSFVVINGLPVNTRNHVKENYSPTWNMIFMYKMNFILPFQTIGRLRSRIADQLLNELDVPDHHETLIKLKEFAREKAGQK